MRYADFETMTEKHHQTFEVSSKWIAGSKEKGGVSHVRQWKSATAMRNERNLHNTKVGKSRECSGVQDLWRGVCHVACFYTTAVVDGIV